MPSPIVDVIEYSDGIVVPDGADFMDNAADVVSLFVQKLANRTGFLKSKIDIAVLQNAVSTITGALVINTPVADQAMIYGARAPGQDTPSNLYPGNHWRPIVEQYCDSTGSPSVRTVGLYAGNNAIEGEFAITVNARWHVQTARWRQQNSLKTSFALIGHASAGTRVCVKNAGVFDWESWQGDGITYASGFFYPAPQLRTQVMVVGQPCGKFIRTGDGSVRTADGSIIQWPIRLPRNANWGNIQIKHREHTPTHDAFQLVSRVSSAESWEVATLAGPDVNADFLGTLTASTGTLRLSTIACAGAGAGYDSAYSEVFLAWNPLGYAGGGTLNEVVEIRMVDWEDPGPINV